MLPALKVFVLVVAFWAKYVNGTDGLQGFVQANAYQNKADCDKAGVIALKQINDMAMAGVVAYSVKCVENDMTLVGENSASTK